MNIDSDGDELGRPGLKLDSVITRRLGGLVPGLESLDTNRLIDSENTTVGFLFWGSCASLEHGISYSGVVEQSNLFSVIMQKALASR